MNEKKIIESGKTVLGIELGSTRMKAVLTDENHRVLAAGSHSWENQLENGIWTYELGAVWDGLRDCYSSLAKEVERAYGVRLRQVGAIGISAMMHGYLAFDQAGNLLVPFRTWRNTMTEEAAAELTEAFGFPIPQRWSVAHLYHAIKNKEPHVGSIDFLTTLSGYVHWKLTGERVLGAGDASGMFPVQSGGGGYDPDCLLAFHRLAQSWGWNRRLEEILPDVLLAGEPAGRLTQEGASLLDASGQLQGGAPLCPPEGDAGTGMTATNSIAVRTGNVSAGTSVFAMVILEKPLNHVHSAIDLVASPDGKTAAMVHCNNGTSDLNAWAGIFKEFAACAGFPMDWDQVFGLLYRKALEGDPDCGGLLAYNYISGESLTGFEEGRPLFVRRPESRFDLSNFMRTHLYTFLGALKNGMEILQREEQVKVDRLYGHGGFFKTPEAGQRIMAAAMNAPVSVMETAGEGGAWGISLLAAYRIWREEGESLEHYLNRRVFAGARQLTQQPVAQDVEGFERFLRRYNQGLPIERAALEWF